MTTLIPKYDQGGSGAVNRPISEKLAESISVFDYIPEAYQAAIIAGTSTQDVTSYISACIAAVSNIGTPNGGVKIVFPKGTYLCNVAINGTINNSMGEWGICLSGYGATLVGRSTDTSIITLNGAVAGTADPAPGNNKFTNGMTIEGFTLNMTNMTNLASRYAIAGQHTYNSSLKDVHVIYEPALGGGFFLGSECYTWDVNNLNCGKVQIAGYNGSDNLNSSMTFNGLVANQVILTNVFGMGFFGGVIQGNSNHFVMNYAQAITVSGMDLEGGTPNFVGTGSISGTTLTISAVSSGALAVGNSVYGTNILPGTSIIALGTGTGGIGTYTVNVSQTASSGSVNGSCNVYNFGISNRYVTSVGNTAGGYNINNYSTGFAPNSYLEDRPPISTLQGIGVYGKADSQGKVAVTSTATPIYNFLDTLSGNNYGLFLISVDNGYDGAQDLIMVSSGVVTVINSTATYGSPSARTYTNVNNQLLLSMSSTHSANFVARTTALVFLDSII